MCLLAATGDDREEVDFGVAVLSKLRGLTGPQIPILHCSRAPMVTPEA